MGFIKYITTTMRESNYYYNEKILQSQAFYFISFSCPFFIYKDIEIKQIQSFLFCVQQRKNTSAHASTSRFSFQ